MIGAGAYDRLLSFESPKQIDDGAGNFTDGFEPQFSQRANIKPLRGGESVLASRLTGVQPSIATIRSSVQARAIAPEWRAYDARAGKDANGNPRILFQIKEYPRVSDNRGSLEFLVMAGVAG